MDINITNTFVNILKSELVMAMGCTEPIAVAYGSAKAAKLLNEKVIELSILASGNIIKNVKSVFVPHTNGLRGLEAASAVGALYGDADKGLNCLSDVTEQQANSVKTEMESISFNVRPLESDYVLDFIVTAKSKNHVSRVRITNEHTNVVLLELDNNVLFEKKIGEENKEEKLDYSVLTIDNIYDFATNVDLSLVKDILKRQIDCNLAIAEKGLNEPYGAQIGRVILNSDRSIKSIAKAYAAAGSDARMNGCELPVVICSGSGNQGLTASLPVIKYAEYYYKSEEEMLRALLVSNLVTLHLKSGIGRLSAYCGAISAGAGAGAGICYMLTRNLDAINHTIVNAIAVSSGVICDGAKASCAAKIALAVDTGILGFEMHKNGNQFFGGDGIVGDSVENTIKNVAVLGHDGMKETDKTIIELMTKGDI